MEMDCTGLLRPVSLTGTCHCVPDPTLPRTVGENGDPNPSPPGEEPRDGVYFLDLFLLNGG